MKQMFSIVQMPRSSMLASLWRGVLLHSSALLYVIAVVAGFLAYAPSHAQGFQHSSVRCYVGFLYQISYQENWGDSYAVVVDVMPDSPASRAGLRMGDVLRTVDGRETVQMDEEAITAAILDPSRSSVQLGIQRVGGQSLDLTLHKECIATDVILEDRLAEAFGMYSLEDVTKRRFTMPFIYTLPTKNNFAQYKTFSFSRRDKGNQVLRLIADELTRKGLQELPSGGDLTVTVVAEMVDNPDYRDGSSAHLQRDHVLYRADASSMEILPYPFLGINTPAFSGLYRLNIDVEFYDTKDMTKVWSVTVRERMNEPYSPDRYLRAFAPYMFANYPFTRYVMNPTFVAHKLSYRYLGIGYDARDLRLIRDVAAGSPADKAGVRPGDRIVAINGIEMLSLSDELTKRYKDFVRDSWKERDESTTYTNDDGFDKCRYWRVSRYAQIALMVEKPKYASAFAYLFSHKPYMSTSQITDIVLEVERGGETLSLIVKPLLKDLDYVELR